MFYLNYKLQCKCIKMYKKLNDGQSGHLDRLFFVERRFVLRIEGETSLHRKHPTDRRWILFLDGRARTLIQKTWFIIWNQF